jgi:hypothetical protein
VTGAPSAPARLGVLDALGQQAAWWAAVLLAARGHASLAAVAPLLLAGIHLALRPGARGRIAGCAALAALFGLATDTLLARSGLLSFAGAAGRAPAWMVALWAAFGVALTASLRSAARWPVGLLPLAAAAAGPLAYRAGSALGALALAGGAAAALPAVAAQWALGVPLLAFLARRERSETPLPWFGAPPARRDGTP